jgi:hypothetical protein
MRTRQRLLHAVVTNIIADVDEATREVVLTIHWRGGQHSHLRVRKSKSGEHGCHTRRGPRGDAEHGDPMVDEDIAASHHRITD